MKKNILLLILILILTGCTSEYNINFDNDEIKENIVVTIPDSSIPIYTEEEREANIAPDDPVTPFIENDQYPFLNNEEIKYKKNVDKKGDITTVTLDYTYTHDSFQKARTFKSCFEEPYYEENKDSYTLNFSGNFYCLYGDELKINLKTNNEVLENNADEVKGNVYTWIVNRDNYQKLNINIEISKKARVFKPVAMIILGIIGTILIVGGIVAYIKIKNRESVNEI